MFNLNNAYFKELNKVYNTCFNIGAIAIYLNKMRFEIIFIRYILS